MPGHARPGRPRGGGPTLTLLLSLALSQTPQPPPDLQWARIGEVLVVARKPDLNLAIGLAEDAGIPRDWYGLGRRSPGAVKLIVIRGNEPVAGVLRERAPSWGAGFTFPHERTIVVRADAGEPRRILRHELAHLALHDAIRVRVPLWFDEGYAALAAGELDRLEGLRLNLSIGRGQIPSFFELDRGLRGGETTARTSYALAAAAVALLARRHPDHALTPLLDRLAGGDGFDAAVLATTGSTVGRFELEWQKDMRKRYGLLGWITAGGVWLGAAVLVVLAVWLRRRRDVPRRRALDEGWEIEPDAEPPVRLDEAGSGP